MVTNKPQLPNWHSQQVKRLLKKETESLKSNYDEADEGFAITKKLFYETPTRKYNDYLVANNTDPSELFIADAAQYLTSYYGAVPYRNSCFELKQPSSLHLSKWANYFSWHLVARRAMEVQETSSMLTDSQATLSFCLQIICGWPRQANMVGHLTYAAWRQKPESLQSEFDKCPAFIFSMFCELQNLPFNNVVFEYLHDDYGVYAPIIANWRTKDVAQVSEWVNQMADYHLEQTKKPKGVEWGEFELPGLYLFPYEILAFLRLREWLGLPNPTQFDHPLMTQPMAFMPTTSLPVPEFDPLTVQVMTKYRAQYAETLQNLTPAHFEPVVKGLNWEN